jgi:serine protease Do
MNRFAVTGLSLGDAPRKSWAMVVPRVLAWTIALLVLVVNIALPAVPQRSASLPDVARAVSPSVVIIVISDKNGNYLADGSGFVVDPNGLIATNLHVIKGAYSASVTLANGDTYDSVLVADVDARKDLALLQIKAVDLKPVRLGDSDLVQVGQHVVAVGNPRRLANSVSPTFLNRKGRSAVVS